ncbi:uncharacterized protein BJ212DRAFT_1494965 [Suillus subaureus]|uniref:Uncharacterized protein n=1 Tax=Suillus subaureus TaxID=48587 RepID=A0A9P7JKB1_9AGAM|nr:uncharacterized protein BJ212DRAFT_1494965 [Suillus subaureus]KAG1827634.1 hypothetical protein BJ212DRAFT_1494965 [Suillus subaureus]
MAGFLADFIRLTPIISGHTIILAFGHGFLDAVFYFEYLAPPNQASNLWRHHPDEPISTVLMLFRLWGVETLDSRVNGPEFDMSVSASSTLLHEEFAKNGFTDVQDNSFEVIDIGDMLSGVAAAGYTFSRPGIFNFDGTKYNTSTRRTQVEMGVPQGVAFFRPSYARGLRPSTKRIRASSGNVQLLSFIAGVAKYQTINSQGLVSNAIGDTLYLLVPIYSSTTHGSINDTHQMEVYIGLGEYWRGVVVEKGSCRIRSVSHLPKPLPAPPVLGFSVTII